MIISLFFACSEPVKDWEEHYPKQELEHNDPQLTNASSLSTLNEGDLVITEIMVDPSQVYDWKGEWFEIYNNTSSDVNLNGLEAYSAGSTSLTVSSDIIVTPGEYALFSVGSAENHNGGLSGVDYVYSYYDLKFYIPSFLSIAFNGTTFDTISWDPSVYPMTPGASLSTNSFSSTDNDSPVEWCLGTTPYGDGDLGTPGSANDCPTVVSLSAATAGDLVISEIMMDPSAVSDWKGEWFEIYNKNSDSLNLNGLEVGSAGNIGFTISSDLVIPSNEYAIFAVNSASSTNGGLSDVDYSYLYNDLKLYNTDSLSLSYSGTVFDSVSWDASSYEINSGTSLSARILNDSSNDLASNWCHASSSYGDGDLGTPGTANDCLIPNLSIGDLVISEIMVDPSQVNDWKGEWFEIYNTTSETINLHGLQIGSRNNNGFIVSENLFVEAFDYIVFAVSSAPSLNGGNTEVDYSYSYNDLKLDVSDSLTLSINTTIIDSVSFSSGFGVEAGSSLTLASLDADDNDFSYYWCSASSSYGDGDLGTPGTANDCLIPNLSIGDLVISEIMADPSQVNDWKGEWFEVYNTTSETLNLKWLRFGDHTISTDLYIAPADYLVFGVNSFVGTNGGNTEVDYVYPYADLRLTVPGSLTLYTDSTELDSVSYNQSDFDMIEGTSISTSSLDITNNDYAYNWCNATTSYGDGDLGTPGATNDTCPAVLPLSSLSAGDLIITEIMVQPRTRYYIDGTWFEIYNNTSSEVSLYGLEIFSSALWTQQTINSHISIEAGGYLLLARTANSSANGGLTDVDIEQHIFDSQIGTITIGSSAVPVIDTVSYDQTWFHERGKSLTLGVMDADLNDIAGYWCTASSTYGDGDFGTPRAENDECDTLPTYSSNLVEGDLVISEIMADPAQVDDWKGEWFEIYNNTSQTLNLYGLEISSSNDVGFIIFSDLYVDAGEYLVFSVGSNSGLNGGLTQVDYVYDYNDLKLFTSDSLTLSFGSTTIDTVSYDATTFGITAGSAISTSTLDATDNDDFAYWCNATSSYGDGDLGTPGSINDECIFTISSDELSVGDLIITEILTAPTQTQDSWGEWFEIYNNTNSIINLNGLSISGSLGLSFVSDRMLNPGQYILFARRDETNLNGGLPVVDIEFHYSLGDSGTITISHYSTGLTIDSVSWDSSWPLEAGKSMSLSVLDATANDSSSNWCLASSVYGDGDLGTPGESHDSCGPSTLIPLTDLVAGDLVISEIMVDPDQVVDWNGEWFEIYNTSSFDINLNGLDIESNGETGFTVSSNTLIPSGEYFVFGVDSMVSINGGLTEIDYVYDYNDCKFLGTDSLTLSVNSIVIDTVSYDSTNFNITTGSAIGTSSLDAIDNDSASNWCNATSSYGDGDLGTPGSANDPCP